jgi:hypothetical protein
MKGKSMTPQVLEGAWEDILRHSDELTGRQVRLTVLPEDPQTVPNGKALAALREIAERQKGRRHTSGENTQKMLRQARGGGMYGLETIEA